MFLLFLVFMFFLRFFGFRFRVNQSGFRVVLWEFGIRVHVQGYRSGELASGSTEFRVSLGSQF